MIESGRKKWARSVERMKVMKISDLKILWKEIFLENRSVDEKRIFKEYGGRIGTGSFASKNGLVALLINL